VAEGHDFHWPDTLGIYPHRVHFFMRFNVCYCKGEDSREVLRKNGGNRGGAGAGSHADLDSKMLVITDY